MPDIEPPASCPGAFISIIKPVIVDNPSNPNSSAHTTGIKLMNQQPTSPFRTEYTMIVAYVLQKDHTTI